LQSGGWIANPAGANQSYIEVSFEEKGMDANDHNEGSH
jgi:hypothetical protein